MTLESKTKKPTTVLVVDDVWISADLALIVLEQSGFKVKVVYSGSEALKWLESNKPAVVLCDLAMPGMDGHAVAKAIHARFGDARPRMVAYTAYRQEEERVALTAGFDDLISKPAPVDVLAATIKHWAWLPRADQPVLH
ncbi:MAG TPA: response regulator [Burkholderiales bacterium]|nr:response regulator [Burkholderiales bacterium]